MAEAREVLEMLSSVLRNKSPTPNERVGTAFNAMGGMIEPGNIDLKTRPVVKNADGSISTVRSMSVNIDGKEVLIPTVSDDGRILGPNEAVDVFRRTGRHLGMFDTPANATSYAEKLHQEQERLYAPELNTALPRPTTRLRDM